jgi:hypothetical protein
MPHPRAFDEKTIVCAVRLPTSFVQAAPAGVSKTEWIRSNIPVISGATTASSELGTIERAAISTFVNFFKAQFEEGTFDEFLSSASKETVEKLVAAAEILEAI